MSIHKTQDIGELLRNNAYPGRGIVIGQSADGEKAAVAYFITGRSANSRNRVFKEEGGGIATRPFDTSRVEDPSLIIYAPIRTMGNYLIVTNGDQTDTIYEHLLAGGTFEQALGTREFEPDAPNFTPRISGLLTFADGGFTYKMSILKSADERGTACDRHTFSYAPQKGAGRFIHTYGGDGDPLPSFTGEPWRVAVPDGIDGWTAQIWNNLNEENKISLYVRFTDLRTGETVSRLLNKYS
ncbi:MAG: IMP cyclohydrolase [Oscillospiraceae bacterium]|nr:IMP cyclohydrolase [Oscillospiraceae bacterium]